MNFMTRAILYISRKKGKTVSLFLLVFVVAAFLISCFEIMEASEHLSKDIRTSLGAAFYIRASTNISVAENGETQMRNGNTHITQEVIDEIMELGEIKFCNPINYGFAKSDAIQFIPGEKHTDDNNMGKVIAISYSALAPDFADQTVVLTEGNPITTTDRGAILISERLAEANHLSVGDRITLTHAKLSERNGNYVDDISVKTAFAEVEVSGIYKINIEDTALTLTAGVADNEIYSSLDVLDTLMESEAGIYTGEVDFYITDPADLEPITRDVQLISDIDWTTHFIRTNDFQYSKIAEQLSSLVDLVKILLVCISVVSTVILTLILTMKVHVRIQEVGILLSVGISKRQILGQFILEVLFVTVAAFVLSYTTTFGTTKIIAESVFQEIQPHLLNEQALVGNADGVTLSSYLHLSVLQTITIYLLQVFVVFLSTLVSSAMIMRLKPKEILSKMS